MIALHTHKARAPILLAKRLFKLERRGKYEEALAEVQDIWDDKSALPDVSGYGTRDGAELLLRCGSLFGFLGHIKQLPGAQEKSRTILEQAKTRFLEIYDVEKIAECDNYIALSYWRSGEYNEAISYLDEALSHNLPGSNRVRLHSYIVKGLVSIALKRYEEIIEIVTPLENDFLNSGDDCLIGDFHTHSGVANRNLGRPDAALQHYELAKFHYRKAQHKGYLALIYNNLAFLHKAEGRFTEALESIEMAIKLLRQTRDRTREGFAYDTKALIYFDSGDYDRALTAVETGISILKKSQNSGFLAETYLTKAKVLINLDDFAAATFALLDAVNIARTMVDDKMAARFVSEFEQAYKAKNPPGQKTLEIRGKTGSAGQLNLVLPPALAHYTDYQGVWISNSHLEATGLRQGSLAVVVNDGVKRGDLVAVVENETDEIRCGFYDSEFGIICLSGVDSEPFLFDEGKVAVLGRIIGVCDPASESGGKLTVEPVRPQPK